MMNMQFTEDAGLPRAYKVFGKGSIDLVIEAGLGTCAGEWWHIAERLSEEYCVLLYERQRKPVTPRTPVNIGQELYSLLEMLGHREKIILLAHSQGGLYAQQFARLYPDMVRGLILIDPLSANDNSYKEFFTPEEQKKSGFDKAGNLVIMEKLAKLHLGFLIKSVMKKAPPFYYYDFSKDAKEYILSSITETAFYHTALEEYRLAHDEDILVPLRKKEGFPDIPLALITHSSEFSIREIVEFGRTDRGFAQKVEDFWQSLMKEYLSFSNKTKFIQAKDSGHFIHLTEPGLIYDALIWIEEVCGTQKSSGGKQE